LFRLHDGEIREKNMDKNFGPVGHQHCKDIGTRAVDSGQYPAGDSSEQSAKVIAIDDDVEPQEPSNAPNNPVHHDQEFVYALNYLK